MEGDQDKEKEIDQQKKRLKINRACYTCRVKKRKCDGLQPCMQCKARQNPCSYSKSGELDDQVAETPEKTLLPTDHRPRTTHLPNTNVLLARQEERHKTMQRLESLSQHMPGEGRSAQWRPNIDVILQPTHRTVPVWPGSQPPHTQRLNHRLISLYFQYRHPTFPILPHYAQLLRDHDDLFRCPLLVLSLYAHGAQFSQDETSAETYYRQASKQVDMVMDYPCLSTVIALALLSLYESTHADHRHRSLLYSTLACRMVCDLGLSPISKNPLHQRVFWACYCLERTLPLTSCDSFIPCLLVSSIDSRSFLSNDTIDRCLAAQARFWQQYESSTETAGLFDTWQCELPPELQWKGLLPAHPSVAHLHLVASVQRLRKAKQEWPPPGVRFASPMVHLAASMVEQPGFVLAYALVAHGVMEAIKVALTDCAAPDPAQAHQARLTYRRGVWTLMKCANRRRHLDIDTFTEQLYHVITAPDYLDEAPTPSITNTDTSVHSCTSSPHAIAKTLQQMDPTVDAYAIFGVDASNHSSPALYIKDTPPCWPLPLPTQRSRHGQDSFDPLWSPDKTENHEGDMPERLIVRSPLSCDRNIGLGIYASARRHHTDVIRQHIPQIDANSISRPVILNRQGQVLVVGCDMPPL